MDHAPLTTASFAARIAALRLPAAQVPVRVVHESSEHLAVVRGVVQPLRRHTWQSPQALTASEQWVHWNGECVAEQRHRFVEPDLEATATQGSASQTRSLAGQYNGFCQQGVRGDRAIEPGRRRPLAA